MEMIAMLGGLGAAPGWQAEAVPFLKGISAAKTVAEVDAVIGQAEQAGLPANQLTALKVVAMERKDDITTPFYKKPLYWAGVAVVGAVAYNWWDKRRGGPGIF